uniref:Glycosyltransferase family 92 protein n=1 Tax=Parascaris univalens TaxID=6257 RepID=A0A915CG81_PARUN
MKILTILLSISVRPSQRKCRERIKRLRHVNPGQVIHSCTALDARVLLTLFPLTTEPLCFCRRLISPLTESLQFRRSLQCLKYVQSTSIISRRFSCTKSWYQRDSGRDEPTDEEFVKQITRVNGLSRFNAIAPKEFPGWCQQPTNQRLDFRSLAAVETGRKDTKNLHVSRIDLPTAKPRHLHSFHSVYI